MAKLNGQTIKPSSRRKLEEAIVAVGFAKHAQTLDKMLPTLNQLIHKVRKVRIMGSAALATVYVATGRMDAYIEYGLRLWDIAAGGLIPALAGTLIRLNLGILHYPAEMFGIILIFVGFLVATNAPEETPQPRRPATAEV